MVHDRATHRGNRRSWRSSLVLALALAIPAAAESGVEDVAGMLRAGLDEETIYSQVVRASRGYDMQVEDVFILHDLGASDRIIEAMMRRGLELCEEGLDATGHSFIEPTGGYYDPDAPTIWQDPPAPAAPVEVFEPVVFRESLDPYGDWVDTADYGAAWRPTAAVVDPGWRPYQDGGRWIYSDYGWTWVSSYSWGWAPYHYGRWYRDPCHGWVWTPGNVWAPAWVSWRSAPDYVGWAPLPPRASDSFFLSIFAGDDNFSFRLGAGDFYLDLAFGNDYDDYTFLPTRHLADRGFRRHCLPVEQTTAIYQTTHIVNNYTYVYNDNRVVVEGPTPISVARASGREIVPVSVVTADRPRTGGRHERIRGDRLELVAPRLERGGRPAPVSAAESTRVIEKLIETHSARPPTKLTGDLASQDAAARRKAAAEARARAQDLARKDREERARIAAGATNTRAGENRLVPANPRRDAPAVAAPKLVDLPAARPGSSAPALQDAGARKTFETRARNDLNGDRARTDANASRRAADAAKRRAEESAQQRAQESANRRAADAAKRRAEESAQQRAQESANRRAADAAKRRAEEWAQQRAQENANRRAADAAKRRAEESAQQRAQESANRRAADAAKRRAEESAQQRAQESANRRAADAAKRRAEESAQQRAQESANRRAADAAKRRAEESAQQRAQESANRRAADAAKRRAEESAQQRAQESANRRAADAAKRRAEEWAQQRAQENANRHAADAAKRRAEESAQQRAQENANRRAADAAKRRAEESAQQRAQENANRRAADAAQRRAEESAQQRAQEDAKRRSAEAAKRSAEAAKLRAEESARQRAQEEAAKRRAAEAARARAEASKPQKSKRR